jgi:hypothetical protein
MKSRTIETEKLPEGEMYKYFDSCACELEDARHVIFGCAKNAGWMMNL